MQLTKMALSRRRAWLLDYLKERLEIGRGPLTVKGILLEYGGAIGYHSFREVQTDLERLGPLVEKLPSKGRGKPLKWKAR